MTTSQRAWTKTSAVALSGVVAMLAACSSERAAPAARTVEPERAGKLLVDRNWIDRMPERHDDKLHVFRFVPKMGGGVYQDRTVFEGHFELFKFEVKDGAIEFRLPAKRQRARSAFTIQRVDGPEPFDLKLTLADSPRGPKIYYGIESETGQSTGELDAQLDLRLADVAP